MLAHLLCSIQAFLLDILPQGTRLPDRQESPTPSLSLVGQPSTMSNIEDDDLMKDFREVYGSKMNVDPKDFVLNEQLDDADELMMNSELC
jgi:hypothetical protein